MPMLSSEEAKATRPYRDIRPYVGLKPTMPQSEAGCRTEPPVSEPSAARTTPDATATADPPELPPGTRVVSHGFFAGPNAELSFEEPIANSSMFVLPMTIAPASLRRLMAVASYCAR